MFKKNNAPEILEAVKRAIEDLEYAKNNRLLISGMQWRGYGWNPVYRIDAVYEDLSIFDWWNDTLSRSQLEQMKKFLETAIKLGFDKYVCFKVGAAGCSHGMWACKNETTNGSSPDGDCLFHSFRSGENYWDAIINGEWLHSKYEFKKDEFTLKEIKYELGLM